MSDNDQSKQIIPHSFTINFSDTGWEKIDINRMLFELYKTAGISEIIQRYTKLEGGCFNLLLKVETNLSIRVVKISPLWNKGNVRREIFALSYLRSRPHRTFRLAREFLYLPVGNSILNGHEILLSEYIPGRKPSEHELESEKFHAKIAKFLDQIHKQKMKGFGWLNNKYDGRNETWQDFLLNIDNLDVVTTKNLLSKADIDWLMKQLITKYNYSFEPVLLYGDLKPENILIKEGEIYIIDFENCFSGHKYYDVGIGLFFIPQIWEYLDIYLQKTKRQIVKRQIILYAMRHAISCLGHRICIGDKDEADVAKKRFFELKKLYESRKVK